MHQRLILGGPGCGKTTRLLAIVAEELQQGVRPDQIAFVSFTKAAATEAQDRAAARFGLNPETDLPWFRTIHSLAYAQLSLSKEEVMGEKEYTEFARVIGETFSHQVSDDDPFGAFGIRGDVLLRIVDYAATTGLPLQESWRLLDDNISWHDVKRFDAAYTRYKIDTARMDFTDMLLAYANDGPVVPVRVAVIDEAQDLTVAQWAVVRRAFSGAERMYLGGDDDQAIYAWAGADMITFLTLDAPTEVLPISHRLPASVQAFSRRIAARIRERYLKPFQPTDKEGSVEWHQHMESVDLTTPGTWLLVARNTYLTQRLVAMIRSQGYNYQTRHHTAVLPQDLKLMRAWEEVRTGVRPDWDAHEVRMILKALGRDVPQLRETLRYTPDQLGVAVHADWHRALTSIPLARRDFYLAVMRRGQKLSDPPRIRVETIHGVKGAEADHVVVMTDISLRTKRGMELNPDAEHRVFYVGVTRARQSLHLLMPQTDMFYEI